MSERPTLTIAVPCPTCGGTEIWTQTWRIDDVEGQSSGKCPKCTDGTIRQAVSCAGCKWWESWDYQGQGSCSRDSLPDCGLWCKRGDGLMTLETFGCLSWEAKA